MRTPMLKALLIAILLTSVQGVFAVAKPLKVFILAGQSNMQGKVPVRTFESLPWDPVGAALHKDMHGPDGKPVVLDDVYISALGIEAAEKNGKLAVGFGSGRGVMVGPEYTFGIYMHKHLPEPFLIIKTAWGGKSLNKDFRPPGAGETGEYYKKMTEHVRKVLGDLKTYHPAYDEKAGYEIAGFVWFQGWNDLVDKHFYPKVGAPARFNDYSTLLAQLIRDVRKDLQAPKMPFVIGVLGVGGKSAGGDTVFFKNAMAAPALLPEFKGNVVAFWTDQSWDDRLGELMDRSWKWKSPDPARKYVELAAKLKPIEDQMKNTTDKQQLAALRTKFDEIMYTPEEKKLREKAISNKGYHYLGSPKIIGGIGKGFAEALLGMK